MSLACLTADNNKSNPFRVLHPQMAKLMAKTYPSMESMKRKVVKTPPRSPEYKTFAEMNFPVTNRKVRRHQTLYSLITVGVVIMRAELWVNMRLVFSMYSFCTALGTPRVPHSNSTLAAVLG